METMVRPRSRLPGKSNQTMVTGKIDGIQKQERKDSDEGHSEYIFNKLSFFFVESHEYF